MVRCKSDLVLCNANAITLDRRYPHARTIYIKGGLVLGTSSSDIDPHLINRNTQVIDCRGRTVIPAFHDAHCHIAAYAESLFNIDVSPASVRSIEDIIDRIRQVADTIPAGQWIRCAGYNEFYLKEKRHPLRDDLDRATLSHPVKLTHRSGHAHVLNTPALKLACINIESEEPDGGMIERDLDTGQPNGLLYGMRTYLSQKVPPVSGKELESAIEKAGQTLLSLGITTVQDASPGNDLKRWQQFIDWKKKGLFRPRTILMFSYGNIRQMKRPDGIRGELSAGAIKLVLDEVRGELNPPQNEINSMIEDIAGRRLQVAIHAVEETTVNAAIEALSHIYVRQKGQDRHRIEHCSICSPHVASRLFNMRVAVVTNPAFIYYSGERYLADVPQQQFEHLYAINTMLKAGLKVAAGSDAPVAGPDPVKGIYAAVTRRAESGQAVLLQEAITTMDALKLYTSGAAYSCFLEKQLGAISKGKYADLAILNTDPLKVKPEELKRLKVEMTLLNGEVVFTADN